MMVDVDLSRPGSAPLTHPRPVSRARARGRGSIAFWSDVVARRAAIFLFRFFAAGFSYGVDRDDSPIARTRVFPRRPHSPRFLVRARGGRRVVAGRRRSHGDAADRQRDRANGGLCLRRVHSLDFQAGFSGGRRDFYPLAKSRRMRRSAARRFSFSPIQLGRPALAVALSAAG